MGQKIWMDARPLLENSTACQKSMPFVVVLGLVHRRWAWFWCGDVVETDASQLMSCI